MAVIRIAAILKPSKMADIWRLFGCLEQFPSLARNRTMCLSLTDNLIPTRCERERDSERGEPALFRNRISKISDDFILQALKFCARSGSPQEFRYLLLRWTQERRTNGVTTSLNEN
ncbi:hypothetical protein AVEN_129938-1 [Araneus ventricosus]|uniref:Uncharacterized protein n=1 Tax=Araneus ventricosus TaxID=182803 RepID=A0A4Y2I9R0_ARAVE|nr:hypothetical protein AVEN_129938-1 [Araneus ventricosus]